MTVLHLSRALCWGGVVDRRRDGTRRRPLRVIQRAITGSEERSTGRRLDFEPEQQETNEPVKACQGDELDEFHFTKLRDCALVQAVRHAAGLIEGADHVDYDSLMGL